MWYAIGAAIAGLTTILGYATKIILRKMEHKHDLLKLLLKKSKLDYKSSIFELYSKNKGNPNKMLKEILKNNETKTEEISEGDKNTLDNDDI